MYSIKILACYTAATSNIILARTTFLDWAFDEWGDVGGFSVGFILIAGLLYLSWKYKQKDKAENESASQDTPNDAFSTESTPPPEEE